MANKKHNDMADVFEQTVQDKTREYEKARQELLNRIDSINNSQNRYDNGLGDIEDRMELNFLNNELRDLEQQYKQEIASLQTYQK